MSHDLTDDLIEFPISKILKIVFDDKLLVEAFCSRYNTKLTEVDVDREEHPPTGLMYFFSDNTGGYTRKGLEDSLREE